MNKNELGFLKIPNAAAKLIASSLMSAAGSLDFVPKSSRVLQDVKIYTSQGLSAMNSYEKKQLFMHFRESSRRNLTSDQFDSEDIGYILVDEKKRIRSLPDIIFSLKKLGCRFEENDLFLQQYFLLLDYWVSKANYDEIKNTKVAYLKTNMLYKSEDFGIYKHIALNIHNLNMMLYFLDDIEPSIIQSNLDAVTIPKFHELLKTFFDRNLLPDRLHSQTYIGIKGMNSRKSVYENFLEDPKYSTN